jgi:hypothetical protein
MILKIGYDFENLVLKDKNSEMGRRRRRRRRRRRFVVPRPGTTLSHLVKTNKNKLYATPPPHHPTHSAFIRPKGFAATCKRQHRNKHSYYYKHLSTSNI